MRTALVCALLLANMASACALTLGCPEEAEKRHGYGDKATLQFRIPRRVEPDSSGEVFKAYAKKHTLVYSAVGGQNEYGRLLLLDQILESKSHDIAIIVTTRRDDALATATISTRSYACVATEDWRPYWRAFNAFVRSQRYPVISAAKPG